MIYFEAFDKIKTSLEKAEITLKDEHLAIQVILTDEDCGGILYIENYYKKLVVMPYDYYDHNVNVISDFNSFMELITAKKNLGALLEKITIKGDFEAAKDFFDSIKPAKKVAAKKTPAKKKEEKPVEEKKETAKKPTAKKVPAKKTSVKTTTKKESEKSKMTEKKSETSKNTTPSIAEVVEKEAKPAKKQTKK